MSEMKAFKGLCERSTERPWRNILGFVSPEGMEPGQVFANTKLLTLATNHIDGLVAELLEMTERFKACLRATGTDEEFAEAAVSKARSLLASIEEAAKGGE
jgi:hypothetical protein